MKPKFSRNKLKYFVDERFFNNWTSQMAYVLGFTFADGNIYITTLGWDVQKRDLEILTKIKKALDATYPISLQRGSSYRFRISNQMLIEGAIRLGLFPKKNFRSTLPKIPTNLFRHFLRGYLDGDGWVVIRQSKNEIDVGFANGNEAFLRLLNKKISEALDIKPGRVRKKSKITPKLKRAITYQLEFYSSTAFKIIDWAYQNLERDDLFLQRKHVKYLKAKELNEFLTSGTKKVRVIQKREGKPIKQILKELYEDEKLDGVQMANRLGVHSSSIYRWLAQTGIKYPVKRSLHG